MLHNLYNGNKLCSPLVYSSFPSCNKPNFEFKRSLTVSDCPEVCNVQVSEKQFIQDSIQSHVYIITAGAIWTSHCCGQEPHGKKISSCRKTGGRQTKWEVYTSQKGEMSALYWLPGRLHKFYLVRSIARLLFHVNCVWIFFLKDKSPTRNETKHTAFPHTSRLRSYPKNSWRISI